MSENLSYLFVSGIVLGSGPCLVSCAPFLIFYTTAHKPGIKRSLYSYAIFSLGRLMSYILWGFLCAVGAAYLQSEMVSRYTNIIYLILGIFIAVLGVATCLGAKEFFGKTCAMFHQGNVRNVGLAGLLIGFAPCLPLLGILNYVVLVAQNPWDAVMYLLVFGSGTIVSPLVLLAALSGKFAQILSGNKNIKSLVQYVSGGVLVLLGLRIMLVLAREPFL